MTDIKRTMTMLLVCGEEEEREEGPTSHTPKVSEVSDADSRVAGRSAQDAVGTLV